MTSYKLVMPGQTNQYGFLFGGNLLKWVDEIAWMTVSMDYPALRHKFRVALDAVYQFRELRFCNRARVVGVWG
jgi:hypothetical protein